MDAKKFNRRNRTSFTEALTKPAENYERKLPTRIPRPPPPNSRQASVRQNSSLLRTENILPLAPITSENEPLYIEIDEPLYPEILPRNNVTNIDWMHNVSMSSYMTPPLHGFSLEEKIRVFNQRALITKQALWIFNTLMTERHQRLQGYILELKSISKLLDKEKKLVKGMGIAGGTTGAVGGVAAVVGIILAPVTMCTSLVVTAAGVTMLGAAGGMGARASKPNKNIGDKNMIQKLVSNYMLNVSDIEQSLNFIRCEMKEVQKHDLERLQQAGAQPDALAVAHELQSVMNNIKNGREDVYIRRISSEMLLHAFIKQMDQYFKEKGERKRVKMSTKSNLSGKIQLLAQNLQRELDYLNFVWECIVA
ncbi:uncharacterized protein LOC144044225 [Vanacampus margaritifer]